MEQLCIDAEREATGIAFESIRIKDGKRSIIVMCVTGIDQITRLEKAFDLVDDNIIEDWNTLTLGDVAARAARGSGFCFEALRDESGRRSALVLIAAEPRSINILESAFSLPK